MIGVVIPAFRPDPTLLCEYVTTVQETIDPAAIRVEFDTPEETTLVENLGTRDGVAVGVSDRRRGKGAAVTAGFEALAASSDVEQLAFADADGSTPATELAAVIDRVADSTADVCVGSRRHPDATVEDHQTAVRRRLGDAFVTLANALLPVSLTDYQCGAKALTVSAWRAIRPHLYRSGFDWDLEFVAVAAALDRRVVEQPITWSDHPNSTVKPLRDGAALLGGLLVARHRYAVLRKGPVHSTLDGLVPTGRPLIDRV